MTMFELMGLIVLAGVAGMVLLGILCALWIAKVAFKIVLIPVGLAFGLIKITVGLILTVFLLTVGLPVLALGLLLVPLALMALFVWGGFCVLGTVF